MGSTAARVEEGMHYQPGPPNAASPADHQPELLATRETGGRGEHGR